jgi:hypothetical protein
VHCATTNVYDILVDQGATLLRSIGLKSSAKAVVTLTGYTAIMQIRETIASTTTILLLTSSNGGLEINASAGTVLIVITPAQTAALTPGKYVYDLELTETSTGIVTKIIQGNLTVRAEVTK